MIEPQKKKSRKAFYIVAAIVSATILGTLAIFAVVGAALTMGSTLTEEYECTVSMIRNDRRAVEFLGEPIEGGWFAPGEISLKQNERQVNFWTTFSGSKKSADLSVVSYRSQLGSRFTLSATADGQQIYEYDGDYPCK